MKSIGFIGKVDKTELIGYIAKVISATGKKVIMVDATSIQKTRYTIPTIDEMDPQSQYVVQHDGVEIAVGFSNMLELKKYLLSKGEDFNEYDYVMIDTDLVEMIEEYDLRNANELFFVTSYDKLYIHKGVELLKFICALKRRTEPEGTVDVNKLMFFSDIDSADTKYVENVTANLPVTWGENPYFFPYDQGDLSVNIRNQYSNKLDVRLLSKTYKEALAQTVSKITEEPIANVKKVIKNVEKSAKFYA